MSLVLITQATFEVLTLDDARLHQRLEGLGIGSFEDPDVTLKLAAAIESVETLCGPLRESVWDFFLTEFPAEREFSIPAYKLTEISSIKYYPAAGGEVTWAATNYEADTVRNPGRVVLARGASWPSVELRGANGVAVRCKLGWASAAAVPFQLKAAALLQFGHLYENREAVMTDSNSSAVKSAPLARGFDALVANFRVW